MGDATVPPKETEKPIQSEARPKKQRKSASAKQQPNIAAVFGVFFACLGSSIFVLVFRDLRSNQLAAVFAGVMMALAVSVVLFSIVPSAAPIRAAIGLGGAALFYFMIWPQIEKAIHPSPSTQNIRGSIYFVNDSHDLGLRPVSGAEVRVPNTTLKSAQNTGETGQFTIFDVPSNTKELEVLYKGVVYVVDLSKYSGTGRYPVIPSNPSGGPSGGARLRESLIVDVTLEIEGSYWERRISKISDQSAQVPQIGGQVRSRVCAYESDGYIVDDTRPDFPGGLRIGRHGGQGYHTETWDGNCLNLYADGRDGQANVWARDIQIAQKKLARGQCGRAQRVGTKIIFSGVNQIALDFGAALGPCVGPDLPGPLKWTTTVVFKRADGTVNDTVELYGFEQQHSFDNNADLWMNTSGLLTIALNEH